MRPGFTGLAAWWVQRASAVYMLLFAVFLLVFFSLHPLSSYVEWRAWVGRPAITIVILAFFVALLAHMWVGLRDVLLDYARPAGLRRFLLRIVAASLFALAIWVFALLARSQT